MKIRKWKTICVCFDGRKISDENVLSYLLLYANNLGLQGHNITTAYVKDGMVFIVLNEELDPESGSIENE